MYLKSQFLRAALAASVSSVSLLSVAPALAQETETAVEAPNRDVVVVTAQRREERLQDVPISVSAFSDDLLNERGIDGGPNLQLAVPNVTFAKSYYSGYNFQIRGIGTKQTSVTGDSSTGVHFNGAPLTSNRLFEAEFFDVERVEVLRGPQGTLYGRNATGGVVNVISARPIHDFEGMIRGEATSFGGRKMRAMVNIPLIDDQLALRIAGASFTRDGIVDNLGTDNKVDDRNLYSVRASLLWQPTSELDFNLVWQHFNEEDSRLRTGKGLCTRDNGPSSVGGTAVTDAVVRGFLSQGCADASVYTDAAYGTPNSLTSLYGLLAYSRGLASGDIYGNRQPNSLSVIDAAIDPEYKAKEDVATLTASWDITDDLTLTSLTSYYVGFLDARQEENRFSPAVNFNSTALAPGGVVDDPQLGASNRLIIADAIQTPSRQKSQEIRLQSDFDGPLDFSIGALALDYDLRQRFYIYSNAFTYAALAANGGANCAADGTCVFINPSRELRPDGHGNYLSSQPYNLNSKALFGEVYYDLTPDLKFTGGLRYTHDKKTLENYPVRFLTPGANLTPGTPATISAEFKEVTGRAGFDWKPDLGFTDDTLLYAFYSRGYKGGGPNNVGQVATLRPTYDPEFVNAYEIGTKNTLLNGALTLNAAGFFYDYKGYQISKFVNRISVTENIDAEIFGAEFEAAWEPIDRLRFNTSIGLLDTEIKNGESIDPFNRTNHDPNLTFVKTSSAAGCTVPTAALANLVNIIQQGPGAPTMAGVSGNPAAILGACSGAYAASLGVTPTDGIAAQLAGNKLPGSPPWTISLGGQYTWDLFEGWEATARADYYRQDKSEARVFNTPIDEIRGWENANLSLRLVNFENGLEFEAFAHNIFNKRSITDVFPVDEALSLMPNAVFTEPRIYGISLQKTF